MQSASPKIIVICGPTASGKSDVAIRLAKKFDGEIISADSRQIFKGMDIGTGKVTGSAESVIPDLSCPSSGGIRDPEMLKPQKNNKAVYGTQQVQHDIFISEGIPHHLIDVAEPMEEFNVSHFKKSATETIEDILSRDKLPIICGGTGFWINSIVYNMDFPDVEPDEELRSVLRSKSTEELFAMLSELDPARAATIEKQNPVRLIRAIEIVKKLGKVPNLQLTRLASTSNRLCESRRATHNSQQKYTFLQVGIDISREILNAKIKKRLDERFENGMIEEVENLHNPPVGGGVSWEWLEKIGLEYRWISRYLQRQVNIDEMREKLYYDIIHYAKRQMTWLKKNKEIIWLSDYEDIEKAVAEFIGN